MEPIEETQTRPGAMDRRDRMVERGPDRRVIKPQRAGAQLAFSRVATALAMVATGALAVGALAVGALAIGRLAVGRLAIRNGRFGRIAIDELEVGRLVIHERHGLWGKLRAM